MDYESFIQSLGNREPPSGISLYLKAMWYDAAGRWEMSHNIAQDIPDKNGSWMHAYLHRKEGDAANAGYWYGKAGRTYPAVSLEEEWTMMVKAFI